MTKQDLSLSVFTNENYKNLHYTSSSFRNSMYDELEVNKSRFKNCNFNEGIFKNIEAICNCKFTTCG
ncbi:pentapeptide repeat-containing protein, partial [Staphylococcus epidermidis]